MAKFIKLEDWSLLNIDKIERIYTAMNSIVNNTTAEGAEKCE